MSHRPEPGMPCVPLSIVPPSAPPRQGWARPTRFAAAAGLALILITAPAHPWGSFRGVAGFKVADTHQMILEAAYDLMTNDPALDSIFGLPMLSGQRLRIDDILLFEGVEASMLLAPVGPGPDAEGSSLYSAHWYNPTTRRGLGPRAAADWYQRFVWAAYGISGGDQDACKGLAWSAHFLADMFVPYHLNGMPADEALGRLNARNIVVGPAEAGPSFLIDPVPPPAPRSPTSSIEEQFGRVRQALSAWWRDGWGVNGNFAGCYNVFAANHQAAGRGRSVNHIDWFDPWYWNGMSTEAGSLTDLGRSLFSSHASYESAAHDRYVALGKYARSFDRPHPYDPLWRNAPPDFSFAGAPWRAQVRQVEAFAARAAARTQANMELCWRQPEIAIRAAVEAVYTMWRSAYSALKPRVRIGTDPDRPHDGLVIRVDTFNAAWEPCHDVHLKLRVGKGTGETAAEGIEPLKEPIAAGSTAQTVWFAQVDPRQDWDVFVEAVGVYDRTPDLQYALGFAQYRPDPYMEPARPVEMAETYHFVGRFVHTDPQRSYDQYHGEMTLNDDGTFQGTEYLDSGKDVRTGSGIWKFDAPNMTITIDWQPGGEFTGPVSGNTADFTINGVWSNGGSGTLRFRRR